MRSPQANRFRGTPFERATTMPMKRAEFARDNPVLPPEAVNNSRRPVTIPCGWTTTLGRHLYGSEGHRHRTIPKWDVSLNEQEQAIFIALTAYRSCTGS